jgi:CheY-like chemotaxis protein
MKPYILIIDDDEEDREFIAEAFGDIEQHLVLYFPNALQVLGYLKKLDEHLMPNLIVTDYKMPGLDGFSFVSYLKRHKLYSKIKVVGLTSGMTDFEKDRLTTAGVTKIFTKPSSVYEYKRLASELRDIAGEYVK